MPKFWRRFLLWFLAAFVTLSAVIYQRKTGPTNPKWLQFKIEGEAFQLRVPRSLDVDKPTIKVKENPASGEYKVSLLWRRHTTHDSLERAEAYFSDGYYHIDIPAQPPAGKIEYSLVVEKEGAQLAPIITEPVVLRFKGSVKGSILVPHIILMFIAMFFSNVTALSQLLKLNWGRLYAFITITTLLVGGVILGPMVQKAAFGVYWSGWPLGGDLTDNKTLIAFLFWLGAFIFGRKKYGRYLYLLAAVVMLTVYTIPHSTFGSNYDYDSEEVVTGRGQ